MRLPNAERVVVDAVKLTAYCLSPHHPRGRHKARVFAEVLGLTAIHARELESALRGAALKEEAVRARSDEYGQRYSIDFEMSRKGRTAIVRSAWIVRADEDFPRFVTCYLLEERE